LRQGAAPRLGKATAQWIESPMPDFFAPLSS
jgi:hypothetical protein